MSREPTDPMVVMLAALARQHAREELAALYSIAMAARRFVDEWERFSAAYDVKDPYLLVRWLSHERKDRPETWELDGLIDRLQAYAKDYDHSQKAQGEVNRIRLALMGDPDFRGGEAWESIIKDCEATAASASKRRT